MTTLLKLLLLICSSTLIYGQKTTVSADNEISMSDAIASSKDGSYKYYKKGEDNAFTGILYTRYKNGNYLTRQEYKDGIGEGNWINYWPNGNLKEVGTYRENKVEGPIKKYNQNGNLISEGEYKDWRIRVNLWKYYDQNGQLIKTVDYGIKGNFKDVEDYYQKGKISTYRYNQLKEKFDKSKS